MSPLKLVSRADRQSLALPDIVAIGSITALLAVMLAYLFSGGAIVGIDSIVGLYPLYELLGNRLRDGDLPLWNAHVLAGTPLIGDPQSGWLYLPVMVGFGLFSVAKAAVFLSAFNLGVAGFGTYALARALKMGAIGATGAAIAFACSGWYTQRIGCCPADIGAASLLPLALLGVERGLTAGSSHRRIGWHIVTGFALSQIFAVWMGQGTYYTFLAVGAFMAYRNLIEPGAPATVIARFRALAVQGAITGAVTLGLAASALLPRLELYRESILANGYPGERDPGWSLFRATERLLGETSAYAGAVTLPLALLALVILRRRFYAPFWAGLAMFSFIFSTDSFSPVRDLAYAVLPGLERMQQQLPSRILMVGVLALAILAAATIHELPRWHPGKLDRIAVTVLGGTIIVYEFWIDDRARSVSSRTVWPAVATIAVIVAAAFVPSMLSGNRGRLLPVLLLIAMSADLLAFGYSETEETMDRGTISREHLASYYDPSPAAQFLMNQPEDQPFRYLGIDPSIAESGRNGDLLYGRAFALPITGDLIVNNRASLLNLQDVQGINIPMRLQRYDELFLELNGAVQDRHNETVLSWAALQSPLLDLLNVRYIIVPRTIESISAADQAMLDQFSEIYADGQVRILENPGALPRAWLVHETLVAPDDAAPVMLNDGDVDPRQTALTAEEIPGIVPGSPAVSDSVTFTSYEAGSAGLEVHAEQAGLLVISEQAVPGWHATVDGKAAEIHRVNGLQQGIVMPAGSHRVELRYRPRSFVIGAAITGVTFFAILAGVAGVLVHFARSRRRLTHPTATGGYLILR